MQKIYLGKPSQAMTDWCKAKYLNFFAFTATVEDGQFTIPEIVSSKSQTMKAYAEGAYLDSYELAADSETEITLDVSDGEHSFRIEFEDVKALTVLGCYDTAMTSLDVTNCTKLDTLMCY